MLYFSEHSDSCYTLSFYLDFMAENEMKEMKVFEAVQEKGAGMFWCSHFDEICEKGNCGKYCEGYSPCNGKSGRCRFNKTPYSKSDKFKILKNICSNS